MVTDDLFQALERIHPLTGPFKQALSEELHEVVYPRNYFLVQADSAAQQAYFLESGFAASFHFHGHKKIVTGFWQPGDIILSLTSFLKQAPAQENIQLTQDSRLSKISHASLNVLLERFGMHHHIATDIILYFHAISEEKMFDFYHLTVWERYNKLIAKYPGIEMNASQLLIASYLNITPQSLSRLKHDRN